MVCLFFVSQDKNKKTKVVKKHFPRIRRAVLVYIFLSIVPWVVYGVLSSMFFNPFLIFCPLVLQLLNVFGFLWWVRVKRTAFKKALADKATAINVHFAGRGINVISKEGAQDGRGCNDKIVIEVAARTPQLPPLPTVDVNQVYQTVDHLPPHAVAIPMQMYAPQYSYEFAAAPTDRENAGLLQKNSM